MDGCAVNQDLSASGGSTGDVDGMPTNVLAERGGFEPPVELLTLRRFSKPLLSTTQPPLRF